MPISTQISLIPDTDVTLRPTMGHHAQAAFLSLMYAGNPETENTLKSDGLVPVQMSSIQKKKCLMQRCSEPSTA